jgi:hypothetical protein
MVEDCAEEDEPTAAAAPRLVAVGMGI